MNCTLINIDKQGNVFLNDDSIALCPELWELYKHKDYGSRGIRYIVMMYDYKSPYRNLVEVERRESVCMDIYKRKSWYKLEKDIVYAAAEKYKKLQYDPIIEQYNVLTEKIAEYSSFIKDMDITPSNAQNLQKIMLGMEKMTESRENLMSMILSREEDENIHGGGGLSFLELINE
jgi:hypothetical protein